MKRNEVTISNNTRIIRHRSQLGGHLWGNQSQLLKLGLGQPQSLNSGTEKILVGILHFFPIPLLHCQFPPVHNTKWTRPKIDCLLPIYSLAAKIQYVRQSCTATQIECVSLGANKRKIIFLPMQIMPADSYARQLTRRLTSHMIKFFSRRSAFRQF